MTKIEIELDEKTLKQAENMAQICNCSVSELMSIMMGNLELSTITNYPLIGSWADEPELVDQLISDAMKDRDRTPISNN